MRIALSLIVLFPAVSLAVTLDPLRVPGDFDFARTVASVRSESLTSDKVVASKLYLLSARLEDSGKKMQESETGMENVGALVHYLVTTDVGPAHVLGHLKSFRDEIDERAETLTNLQASALALEAAAQPGPEASPAAEALKQQALRLRVRAEAMQEMADLMLKTVREYAAKLPERSTELAEELANKSVAFGRLTSQAILESALRTAERTHPRN